MPVPSTSTLVTVAQAALAQITSEERPGVTLVASL
jgi:hypothetical protein